jgi:hypothetical protein
VSTVEQLSLEIQVPLWDAIQMFAASSRLSVARQKCVVKVNEIVGGLERERNWFELAARKLEAELREQTRQTLFWKDLCEKERAERAKEVQP